MATSYKTVITDSQYTDAIGYWIANKIEGMTYTPGIGSCIGLAKGNKLIGGVLYENYNGASIMAHIALDDAMNKSFLKKIFHYPFIQLKVKKIIAPVSSLNQKAQKFLEKMGFMLECEIKDGVMGGNLLIFTISRKQCRFIGD